MADFPQGLSYSQVRLVPQYASSLEHRADANTGSNFFGKHLDIPLIASPMPDVVNSVMAKTLSELGCTSVLHRFQSINSQVVEFQSCQAPLKRLVDTYVKPSCAIGINGDYIERAQTLHTAGCTNFCIDTANGFSTRVVYALEQLRLALPDNVMFIVGNVADEYGYAFLSVRAHELNIHAIRVGVAGGSACDTKTEAGVHVPMVTAVRSCHEARLELQTNGIVCPLIIADGGVKNPGDFSVALALGADIVMAGGMFAGTEEAPGEVIKVGGDKFKLYRGAASFGVQKEHTDSEPEYNEGAELLVPYKGAVRKVVSRYRGGLRSSMSYADARTLTVFRQNAKFIRVS